MGLLERPLTDGTVRVRRLETGDAGPYVAGASDAQVRRFAHLPVDEYTEQIFLDQLHGVIADGLRQENLAVLAIGDAATDAFLGSITVFDIDYARRAAETGFWVTPASRGRRAASRALELVAAWAADLGIDELIARTEAANEASCAVLKHAGFTLVGGPVGQAAPSGRTISALTYRRSLVRA